MLNFQLRSTEIIDQLSVRKKTMVENEAIKTSQKFVKRRKYPRIPTLAVTWHTGNAQK